MSPDTILSAVVMLSTDNSVNHGSVNHGTVGLQLRPPTRPTIGIICHTAGQRSRGQTCLQSVPLTGQHRRPSWWNVMRLRREVSAAPAACCRNRHQRSDPAIHAGGCRYRRPALSMSGPEASYHTSHNCSDSAASTGGHGGCCRYQRPAIQTEASTLPKYVIQPLTRLC